MSWMHLAFILVAFLVFVPLGSKSDPIVIVERDKEGVGEELLLIKIADEMKEAGLTVKEVDDLKSVARQMNQFLSILPDLASQIGIFSSEDLLYHSQLYLLGLPNSLGPLGYIALHGVMEEQQAEVISPVDMAFSVRKKRSLTGAGLALGAGGLAAGSLLVGAGLSGTVSVGPGAVLAVGGALALKKIKLIAAIKIAEKAVLAGIVKKKKKRRRSKKKVKAKKVVPTYAKATYVKYSPPMYYGETTAYEEQPSYMTYEEEPHMTYEEDEYSTY